MPLPPDVLAAHQSALLETALPADWSVAWVVPAWDPLSPPDEAERPERQRALERRLQQAGRRWLPVRLTIGGAPVDGVASPDLDRASAVKLGYKMKLWAAWRRHPGGVDVVFTGINSRAQ
jgi:hypothetical protein